MAQNWPLTPVCVPQYVTVISLDRQTSQYECISQSTSFRDKDHFIDGLSLMIHLAHTGISASILLVAMVMQYIFTRVGLEMVSQ